ncbi:extensin family protein [Labrenzia sp. 011]|uniref:extensin-like domain-containing protein n=1 Tax=Labrenzia sp. 011 TaxID=2171494 RepID=UPI000D5122BE|nr:extensin family protein [Labrenzia sp. 011]PVB61599.1 hypothetical protein DCO57_10435 [Labrenzia sp. 011]
MQIVTQLCRAFLAGMVLAPTVCFAVEVVPDAKPLAPAFRETFLEGVDTPPAKPRFPEADDTGRKSDAGGRPFAACDIPGALLEPGEPVAGDKYEECQIAEPVRLNGVVDGTNVVKFPAPVSVSCQFAGVLTRWLRQDVLPAAELQFDSPVAVVVSGPGYQCRRRNNRPDGKLSEHALGMAVDISRFQLVDGTEISVEKDWKAGTGKGTFLQTIHAGACQRFTTVLGPDADPDHRSHFHLDIGCHGQDCTYLICQ